MTRRQETPVLGSRGGTMGRPRKPIPPEAAQVLEAGGANGAALTGIARVLGVSTELLRHWLDENDDLREAFARGRERERQMLHGTLTKQAKEGNVIAAIFLLKSRHGYRENDQSDIANRVQITFQLPGALAKEQFIDMTKDDGNTKHQPVPLPATGPVRS